jgi:hypothetical protein
VSGGFTIFIVRYRFPLDIQSACLQPSFSFVYSAIVTIAAVSASVLRGNAPASFERCQCVFFTWVKELGRLARMGLGFAKNERI